MKVTVVAIAISLFGCFAQADVMPDCLDYNGQIIPIENTVILGWKGSTKSGYTARAHTSGTVTKIYRDATGHHHWQATIGQNAGDTVELIYDLKFGAAPTPQINDPVEACGDYITANGGHGRSPDGAILHWIHISDTSQHPSGFLSVNGHLYGQELPNSN